MTLLLSILFLALLATLGAGCQADSTPAAASADHAAMDPISRNIALEPGGALHDPLKSIASPVRRDQAMER